MRSAVAIVGLLFSLGCKEGPVVQVRLVPTSRLDVTTNVSALRIGFFRAGESLPDVDLAPTGGMLDGMTDLANTDGLVAGESYEVRAVGTSAVCTGPEQKVVGRSLPFTHDGLAREVVMQIGCAEEFQLTRGQPIARIGHALVALPGGGAILAGGGGALTDNEFGVTLPVPPLQDVELYDPATGDFTVLPDSRMSQGRVRPGARYVSERDVVVLVGGSASGSCLNSTQVVWPRLDSGPALLSPRCAPTLVPAGGDELLATAGVVDPPYELLPSTLASEGRSIAGGLPRVAPRVASWENDVLVLGGRETGELTPSIEHVRLDCGDSPCVGPVVPDVELPPGLALTSIIGLDCPSREGGTAYVTGGVAVSFDEPLTPCPGNDRNACCTDGVCDVPSEDSRLCAANLVSPGTGLCGSFTPRREVYCFSTDNPRFQLVGMLRAGVYGHLTIALGPAAEQRRLLLIGGVRGDFTGLPQSQPAIANACTCAALDDSAEALTMPAGATVFDHNATTLADGSVLVTGGIDTDQAGVPGQLPRTAERYGVIFFPDLP